jgi:hypothetical protein
MPIMRNVAAAALLALALGGSQALAAVPSSGTLSPSNPQLEYDGGPYTGANPSNQTGDPDCSLVPNTCDDYALTIDIDGAWLAAHPTAVVEIVTSWPGASDFDLYFQDQAGTTIENSGANAGMPERILYVPVAGVNQYRVRTLVFAAANETFHSVIRLFETPPVNTGAAIHVASTDVFTCNKHLEGAALAFDHGGDGEPAVAIQPDGTTWVTGIAGVGAGIGLWKIAPADVCVQSPAFQNQPDAGAGGGDTDIAIAPEANALGFHNIYTSSLSLANVTSSTSLDGGATFALTPISTPSTVQDRQWNAAYGVNTLYLSFNIGATQPGQVLKLYRSSGAGLGGTFVGPFLPRGTIDPTITYGLGDMAVDTRPGGDEVLLTAGPDGQGNVYHGWHQNDGNEVWVGVSRDFGTTWIQSQVTTLPEATSAEHKFTWVAVDGGGNVYTCWATANNVYYSVSQDIKTSDTPTWSAPIQVNNGPMTKTCVLPMIEAGSAGRIVFGFYGTTAENSQTAGAPWHYFHARCNNATDVLPVIEQLQVSDHVVHTGVVCLNGLGCSCCRELLECQELAVNPVDGSTFLTYGGASGIYASRQVAGVSGVAGKTIVDNSGPCPALTDNPPCTIVMADESTCIEPGATMAVDPSGDQGAAGNAQQDIRKVSIAEPWFGPGVRRLVFTMKVAELGSDALTLAPNTLWTILWTHPSGGEFPQKFVQMNSCDPSALPTFAYGHVEGVGPSALQSQDGTLTSGVSYSPDGTIRIEIDPVVFGPSTPDLILENVQGETRLLLGSACSGLIQQLDTTNPSNYTLRGNNWCEPQTVTCPPSVSRTPGTDIPMTFLVNNPSTAARLFNVQLDDGAGWIVGGPVNTTVGPVSPGSSGAVDVLVRMDSLCNPDMDVLSFDATAADLPTPNEASCATTVNCIEPVAGVGSSDPRRFRLALAGANPSRGSTMLSYAVPQRSPVKIEVYSVMGQRLRTLVDRVVEPGEYTVRFALHEGGAHRLSPGIYLVRMTAGDWTRGVRVIALN